MSEPTGQPQDLQKQVDALALRLTALEEWLAWFKGYLLGHPGGVSLLGEPKK